ncbi:MAG: sulfotransferase [Steroidobacteraceae bacterium]
MSSAAERKTKWVPAPRPEWVQRINEEGYCMNSRGVVPLDPDSLIHSAMLATGLSDFGADEWREPFAMLCQSMDEDAELNLMGRIRTRSEILQLLEARLHVEDWYKRHPEIDQEVIKEPMIVIGQGRSGTSFLVNLLAADPNNGALRTWEAIFPCPPPEKKTYFSDPRIQAGHLLTDQWNRVTPEIASMHEFAGLLPMECPIIMGMSFMSPSWFSSLGQCIGYLQYCNSADPAIAYDYHKRVLKLLQWRNPRKHWVLKAVWHLDMLPTVVKTYPDAFVIWPHRDPVRSLASGLNIVGTIHWGRSDHPFKNDTFDFVQDSKAAAQRLNAGIDAIESGIVPKAQLFNLLYTELVADPLGMIQKLYAYFGVKLTPAGRDGIVQYLHESPRSGRPVHRFQVGPREVVDADRVAFKRYQDYFGVANE